MTDDHIAILDRPVLVVALHAERHDVARADSVCASVSVGGSFEWEGD
jgi:hypothetical protein